MVKSMDLDKGSIRFSSSGSILVGGFDSLGAINIDVDEAILKNDGAGVVGDRLK